MFAGFKARPTRHLILPLMVLLALAGYAWRGRSIDSGAAQPPAVVAVPDRSVVAMARDPESAATIPHPENVDATATIERSAAAPVRPYRATVDQRQRDRERLDSDPDLVGLEAELKARAQAGDADAAWALADLDQGCAAAAEAVAKSDALTQQLVDLQRMGYSDTEIGLVQASVQGAVRRCSTMPTRSRELWRDLVASARARAASLGHPGAQLMRPRPRGPANSSDARQAYQRAQHAGVELLQAGDPMDLVRYASELASLSPYHPYAYRYAACTLLDGCLRDPTHYGLTHASFQNVGGNELIYLRELSPRTRLIIEAQSAEILRLWQVRQFGQLLTGPLPPPGSGGG